MSKRFYGKTYLYPTPNDNEQEIGVTRFSDRDRAYVVGFIRPDGTVERVLSASIPCETGGEPDKLQQRLDKRAAKLKLKPASKEVVVRERMEASQVLPPEAATPYAPDVVTAQYKRAVAGALEMVRFGAMLVEIDMALTAGGQDPNGRRGEESLHGWLEAHCPDVNYKTAMKFKYLAEGVQRSCNVPAKVPLSLAMPNHDGTFNIPDESPVPFQKLKKLQQEVWALVEGKSARQLQFAFASDEPAPKGGANHTKKLTEEEAHEAMVKAANAVWNTNVEALVDNVKRLESHLLLTGATVGKLLTKLGIVVEALNAAASRKE